MRLNREQIVAMVEMQANVNHQVNPQWTSAGYPFLRAAVVEGAEAIEHWGWKWWKHQETNLPQVQMELVDIWHFILSAILIDTLGDIQAAAGWLEKRVAALEGPAIHKLWLFGREFRIDGLSFVEKMEMFIGLCVFRKISIPLFDALLSECGMSWQDLYVRYVAKNVLNTFRQNHGYKVPGKYRKHWHDGREDNEHLVDVLADLKEAGGDLRAALYAALEERYGRAA